MTRTVNNRFRAYAVDLCELGGGDESSRRLAEGRRKEQVQRRLSGLGMAKLVCNSAIKSNNTSAV